MNRRIAHAAQIGALILALALVPVAFAARASHGGGGNTPNDPSATISLVLLNSTDGLPHFGQKVTFNVSTTATTKPWVTVYCYVGGAEVYKMSNGIFPTSLNQDFTLGPTPSWSKGEADCTAWLQDWDNYAKHHTIYNLKSMNFHVSA